MNTTHAWLSFRWGTLEGGGMMMMDKMEAIVRRASGLPRRRDGGR